MKTASQSPDRDRFQVMARDPAWVFAYWHLSAETRKSVERGGLVEWLLRFVRLETGEVQEVPIEPDAENWYVEVAPGGVLVTELGVRTGEGGYRPVLPGNDVTLPRPAASDLVDPEWYISREDFLRLLAALYGAEAGSPVRRLPDEEEWKEANWPHCPLVSSHDAQKKPRSI